MLLPLLAYRIELVCTLACACFELNVSMNSPCSIHSNVRVTSGSDAGHAKRTYEVKYLRNRPGSANLD